ncbi:cation diffusion facilitator family transporter [Eikenella exigua]|uniref:cation diffusion facilitator family transporter n=1 Tax=Eikenella exigua TaxID=2528037 RepID=UPI00129B47B5|nr:cation diffusion facilitator family transporter [Eikenella exigua]
MSFHSHEHNHSHVHSTNTHILRVSLAVIAGFMLVEAAAGWLSGSLALLSDAGHMFSDAASLTLALFAFKWAEKAANSQKSYGYQRVEILAATLNGLTLVVMAAWIVVEAVIRAFKPVPVAGGAMLMVAAFGLLVNLFIAWYMLRGEKDNLNMRGAFLHVVGDLLGSVAAVAAGLLIQFYGWDWADLAASAAVALLIGKSGWGVLSGSLHILMEGTPQGTDLVKIAEDIQKINGILGVHDLHAWTITSKKHAMSCHIIVRGNLTVAQAATLAQQVQATVQTHGIGHITVQTDPANTGAACCQACEQPTHEHN